MPTLQGDIRYQILIDEMVDDQLTSDLAEIEVNEAVRGETTFRIRFAIDICGTDMELLDDDRLVPGRDRKVSVLVSLGNVTTCLVHGLITDRKTELKEGGPGSSLEISGRDRRIEMSRNADQRGPRNGTVAAIVAPILQSYDFVPDIDFGDTTLYSEETNSLNQTSSDLELVNKLAGEHGYEFWIDCAVTPSLGGKVQIVETAHFKSSPPRGQGVPAAVPVPLLAPRDNPVLQMNTGDGTSTLLTFSASRVSEVPTSSGPITRVNIDNGGLDRTSVQAPSQPPLGSKPPLPDHRRPLLTAGSAQDAQKRQDAALIDASWIVKANAETTVHALGALLRPHEIVKVSGTGKVDDGDYFVWSVTHQIDPADHKMRCELRRNAVGES
jgi:hypothetical protein